MWMPTVDHHSQEFGNAITHLCTQTNIDKYSLVYLQVIQRG